MIKMTPAVLGSLLFLAFAASAGLSGNAPFCRA